MSKRLPVVETLCNDCGTRTTQHTRTDAFAVMDLHQDVNGHLDQMWSSAVGWTRYRGLSWANCWVADGLAELDASLGGVA